MYEGRRSAITNVTCYYWACALALWQLVSFYQPIGGWFWNCPCNHIHHIDISIQIIRGSPNLNSPSNKMFAGEKCFTIDFIQLMHKTCQIPSAFTNHYRTHHRHCSVSIFAVLPLAATLPNIFTVIPQRIIIRPIKCTAYTAVLNPSKLLLVKCTAILWWSINKDSYWAS